jgi:hypothetical protein
MPACRSAAASACLAPFWPQFLEEYGNLILAKIEYAVKRQILAQKFGQAALKLNAALKPTTTQQWAIFDLARVEQARPASIWRLSERLTCRPKRPLARRPASWLRYRRER